MEGGGASLVAEGLALGAAAAAAAGGGELGATAAEV